MGKRTLKAKSPGKKFRDKKVKPIQSQKKTIVQLVATDNHDPDKKGSGTEDSGSDLGFSE